MPIRWTELAVSDLTGICDYTQAKFGVDAAERAARRIHESLDRLREFPHLGRPGRRVGTRELVIAGLPFLAVYRMRESGNESTIEINRILRGAQQWP